MTNPTITYNHGFLDDCISVANWAEDETGGLGITTTTDGDVFTIACVTNDVANDEYAYLTQDITNKDPTVYTKALVRWRTSETASGVGLTVALIYTGGTQYIVGATTPAFSTSWTVTTATLDTDKGNLDQIRLILNDYPNNVADGTYYVYVDFILICEGIFTFPFIYPDGVSLSFPNRYADPEYLGRIGGAGQYLGMNSPIIILAGNMDTSTSWHKGANTLDAEVLYHILYTAYTDPWQWLTSDLINCKVQPVNFTIKQDSDVQAVKKWSLELKKYTLIQPTTDFSATSW